MLMKSADRKVVGKKQVLEELKPESWTEDRYIGSNSTTTILNTYTETLMLDPVKKL